MVTVPLIPIETISMLPVIVVSLTASRAFAPPWASIHLPRISFAVWLEAGAEISASRKRPQILKETIFLISPPCDFLVHQFYRKILATSNTPAPPQTRSPEPKGRRILEQ